VRQPLTPHAIAIDLGRQRHVRECEEQGVPRGQAGVRVALDLASFEVVRAHLPDVLALLRSGGVEACFGNEARRCLGAGPACAVFC
jgi:hypothetical protein